MFFLGKLDEIEKDKSPDIKENGEEKPLDLEDEEGKEEDDSADAQRIEELKGNTYVTWSREISHLSKKFKFYFLTPLS